LGNLEEDDRQSHRLRFDLRILHHEPYLMFNTKAFEAIQYYNGLIRDNIDRSDDDLNHLLKRQRQENILFGDRPLSLSIRPTLLTEKAYSELQDAVYLIRQAVLKIADHFLDRESVLSELGITPAERELIKIPTNVIRLSATARFDAFMTDDSFRFMEINGESPAGAAYLSKLSVLYPELETFQQFIKKFPVRFVDPLQHLIQGLMRVYREEFGGTEIKPVFAIVDKLNIPTRHEFTLIQQYLKAKGMECVITDPRKLELRDGWLYGEGKRIDILYRRLLTNDYFEMEDECQALLGGYKAQKTCFLNTFRSNLVHKKSIFSLLTDRDYNCILSTSQLEAIRKHIPWTRKLTYRKTRFGKRVIDLVDYVTRNKDEFVLKPNDSYGGKGVSIGEELTESEWEDAVRLAVLEGFVVQEVVRVKREAFYLRKNDEWKSYPTLVDLAPYLNGPLIGGCLTRTTAHRLANVTSGGGSIPMFILRHT